MAGEAQIDPYMGQGQQFFSDTNTRIRDIEEKQRLLKDRTLIIGESLVEEREKTFSEMQEIKKDLIRKDV